MKGKGVWLVTSCLIVAGLVLASCAPAAPAPTPTPTPAPAPAPVPTPAPAAKEVAPAVEKPKYGGTFILGLAADITGFDEVFTHHTFVYTMKLTNEDLWGGDWARGPAGTGECDWRLGGVNRVEHKAGFLAERWELPEKGTMIFHIRKGVRWHDKPPVSGRELTADDVVFSMVRQHTEPMSYYRVSYPHLPATTNVTAPDKWTVVIKCPPHYFGDAVSLYPDYVQIIPPEVVKKYGDMRDWRVSCGTGPFMLVDYVSGSSVTFLKHPNYWGKDPVGPGKGNQLPYLDSVKFLIITDMSTRYAALRTAKVDWATGVTRDDAQSIMRTNPEIKYRRALADSCYSLFMRLDKKELPFQDKRVRQALNMALDRQAIVRDYYGGEAEVLVWPIIYVKDYGNAYVPLEQLPPQVKELYSYNPEKAKKLLEEAGFPKGFKTRVICYSTAEHVDVLSMVKAMWAKIGVELIIEPKEYAIWMGRMARREYDEMMYGYNSGIGTYYKAINWWGPSRYNTGYIDDPRGPDVRKLMEEAFPDETKIDQVHREFMPYLLEQAHVVTRPTPYTYLFWQPWVKNYRAETSVGYYDTYNFCRWVWLDQDLKEKMTGRR